jgi:hypothetical protein
MQFARYAAHHRGADIDERLLHDRRALVDLSTGKALHPAPHCKREHPVVQAHAADPQRIVHALVGTRNEAVE